MVRIANVNIPDNKRLVISLTYIHGIGKTSAELICRDLSISEDTVVSSMSDDQVVALRQALGQYTVEGDLKKQVSFNIKKKIDMSSYQGIRHRRRLPVRGQNTHSNARTRRGRAIPIAGKKG